MIAVIKDHLTEASSLIAPPKGSPHGPLPPLLLLLTVVTGIVDAFSYLQLGHVLVANMTGNVVFLGFAVGQAPGFIWWASLLAIGTFLIGALAGGRLVLICGSHRGSHLLWATGLETTLLLVALILSLVLDAPYSSDAVVAFIAVLGIAFGLQNSTARALAVPDLTTTVLTLTITGIASDSHAVGGKGSKLGRRLVPITAMFLGGLAGALLVVHGHDTIALLIATLILAVVTAGASLTTRSEEAWTAKR